MSCENISCNQGRNCSCLLNQANSDGSCPNTNPHEETRDLIELALDAALAFALIGALIFTIFAAIRFWSAQ